jgi:3',5'-cyclic AMP phosphodiesterase CpdA
VSDLHVGYLDNRRVLDLWPDRDDDWLIVAGDLADTVAEIEWALRQLASRFARVICAPGNHEL